VVETIVPAAAEQAGVIAHSLPDTEGNAVARLLLRSVAEAGDVCVRLALTRTGTMARIQMPYSAVQPEGEGLLPLSRALRTAVLIANKIGVDVAVIPAREPTETRQ
jgi:hypothetical protein